MSGMNKAERLTELKRLYIQRAWSDIELAEKLETRRETIFRDRRELEDEGYPFIKDEHGRWRIDKTRLISEVKVNLHEALALYLAARRAARQTRFRHPHAANAVEKLAATLRQPMTEKLLTAADRLLKQEENPEKIKILETIAQAWVEQRKVRIEYQALGSEGLTRHDISPYIIEPSIWSDSVYVIAKSDFNDKIFAFKIERILHAFLLGESFELPESFDDEQLLKHAWGVWFADRKPVTVKLRFAPNPAVIQRLEESVWHPLERVEKTEDGGRIWSVEIAEPREMLPWIRGWGADVEALEPKELREALEKEVKKMARVYGVTEIKAEDDLIAHVRKDGKEQRLFTHLTEASQLAEGFAAKVGLPEIGKIMGLLHDFGKASDLFQGYLRSKEGKISPDDDNFIDKKRGEVDHSTAGAQLIFEKLKDRGTEGKILAQFLALAIASHHSGLIDCLKPDGFNEFERRINKDKDQTHLAEAKDKLPDIEKQLDEILAQPIEKHFFERLMGMRDSDKDVTLPFKHGLLARFLLSCVLEADRLNTADFENPGNEEIRNYGRYVPWDVLIERLEAKYAEYAQEMAKMKAGSRAWEVNQLRAQVAQACLDAAQKPKGIYQLTVPTGGGKTLASLRFALHHARAHGMDRVFYIVPYTTIIDQNADKVREILEMPEERDKVVLEHHSNLTPDKETRRHNLLAENWDAPIVFTTQVQFLEALFGSGTRDPRRMHQLANSVIILDEVQTVPIKIVHMLNAALRFLTHDCGATVVLCTATQPPLDKLPENPYRALTIEEEQKIIRNEPELFEKLKRVEVHDERKPGGLTNAEIADRAKKALEEKGSVLIVVNTRASAQALYQEIKSRNLGAALYHLSTNMCPAHRKDVLDNKIKPKLKAKQPVICVSTQLIEAGVDIDFGAVIRALAGLDSIAQSAGRCNREGKREDGGSVWVVNPQEENLDRLEDIKIGREHAQRVLDDFRDAPDDFGNDRIGLNAIVAFYNFYYNSQKDKMNYPVDAKSSVERNDNLFNLLSMNELSTKAYKATHQDAAPDILLRQSFRTANGEFRVIDAPTRGVVVSYGEGREIITELCGAFALEKQGKLFKRAQRYSVNLFDHQLRKLLAAGVVHEAQEGEGIYYLDEQYYSEEFGWSEEPVSDMTVHIE
jgi:CRISPR-associated endonuclease/helicase Cas3